MRGGFQERTFAFSNSSLSRISLVSICGCCLCADAITRRRSSGVNLQLGKENKEGMEK